MGDTDFPAVMPNWGEAKDIALLFGRRSLAVKKNIASQAQIYQNLDMNGNI